MMIIKRCVSSLLLTASLALIALPASAGTNYFSRSHHNNAGTNYVNMNSQATHFCYLSKVGMENADNNNESATCTVRRSGNVWVLEASLGRDGDAEVSCAAHCVDY